MTTQPQLLQIALDKKDVVYTPDWVARDMVDFFKPTGRILEPACGDGAILKYLPGADWCEIEKGVDFFACQEKYDWIVGNPPYSQFKQFLRHSFTLAENIVFVLPVDKPFNSHPNMTAIRDGGGIVHMRVYNNKEKVFDEVTHRPTGLFHFQRGYTGPMYTSFYEPPLFT